MVYKRDPFIIVIITINLLIQYSFKITIWWYFHLQIIDIKINIAIIILHY